MDTNKTTKVIPKEFLQGWIEGTRATLKAKRHAESQRLPKDTPIVTISTAATISYYNGAEHVLNELENLLNNL